MRMRTFLRQDDSTYQSFSGGSGDIAILDAPDGEHIYNREIQQWERQYEQPTENDVSLLEAEVLWTKAHKENDVVAGVLLKVLQL